MGKVFQVETRNTGVLWGLTGGLLISLLLFLILPFTQKLSGSNPKNLLLKVDVSLPPPPPPPPPPPEEEEEEEKPELQEEQQMLTLSQLELALNPGAGGVGIYAGLNPKVSTDAIAEMKIFDLSEVDREPRPLVRIPPQYPPKLLLNRVSGRVDLLIVIDEEGRVTDYQVRRFTHNEFKREVTRVIRQWKFSPAMKDGRKVAVRKVQPFYFGKQR
ncbi:MAG: energy transducer TonB [Verrucomicrobia bacterium]|nr:energy transducer TonB [Verrucomicrobiota bacterium]MBT7735694.1 energy transducer TonB [Verrucomicrobiota bacterium]